MIGLRQIIAAVLVTLPVLAPARAGGQTSQDLARASLEELMNIEITSASRKEERADAVAAAVYVITQDEIRRSGIRTLPELLRLVPGVQVSRINSSNWAISVRGFNDLFANQLLVLVDGRSIYNRSFSGVFWNAENVPLDDIDRIEVVRGAGGAVWGANAVNGVINIVTKSAREAKGTVVRADAGTFERHGSVRHGGALGTAAFRVYSEWSEHGESLLDRDTPASDRWRAVINGFRIDWTRGASTILVDGGFNDSHSRPLWIDASPAPGGGARTAGLSSTHNGWLLGRWTYKRPGGGSLQAQSFYTARSVDDSRLHEVESIGDLDLHYHTRAADRHDLVFGAGLRNADYRIEGSFNYSTTPASLEGTLISAFAQDEIALGRRVRVTLGSRVEHDTIAGWGVQPTARMMLTLPPGRQHLWAAWSRALRTPSASDLGVRLNYEKRTGEDGVPEVHGLVGNPGYRTEEFYDTEAGYRVDVGTKAALDVTAFRGHYNRLLTREPMAPTFETLPAPHLFVGEQFSNLLDADTAGLELACQWTPVRRWRLDASYSWFSLTPDPDPTSRDDEAISYSGDAPAHQWQIRSTVWFSDRVELSGSMFHVGRLSGYENHGGIPAYTRADVHLRLRLSQKLTVAGTGQNLFEAPHQEFSDIDAGLTSTFVPRSVTLGVIWTF